MSKVALSGNASGTGTFTIASPNGNTDRTLTLPDNTGTLLASGGAISGTTGTFSGAVSGTTGSFPSGVSVGPSITFGDATVQTTAAGAPTTTQVLNATAGASAGAVGTYSYLGPATTGTFGLGGTTSGSNLRTTNAVAMSGTWRCMSFSNRVPVGCSPDTVIFGVWLRIS